MRAASIWLLCVCAVLAPGVPVLAQVIPDSTGMDWSRVPEYRLVPGDLLVLNFGPRPDYPEDLTREARIRPDGRISVFPVGDVVAAGRTVRELETALVDLLAADYKLPRVSIEVKELAGNQVHVLGRVDRPGSYPVQSFTTALQAIAAAGGFKDDASRNSVLVLHRDGARTVRVTRVFADRALKAQDLTADPVVGRFDIVYIPRSTIGNIDNFCSQFFGQTESVLSSGLLGWELFNIDRVFVTRVATVGK